MGLLQAVQHGLPAATAFAATVDPEIFYVPWSIFVYVWGLGNAKESKPKWRMQAANTACVAAAVAVAAAAVAAPAGFFGHLRNTHSSSRQQL